MGHGIKQWAAFLFAALKDLILAFIFVGAVMAGFAKLGGLI